MLLQKIVDPGNEDVFLIECSFESLNMNLRTLDYLDKLRILNEGAIESALLIADKNGSTLGVSFKNKHPEGDFWFVIPYPEATAMKKQTEKMVNEILSSGVARSIKTKKVDQAKFGEAVREYLSVSLAEGSLCDCDVVKDPKSFVFNKKRNERIRSLIKALSAKYEYDLKGMNALEICCGNGMSTVPARPLFKSIISIDNDRCAVCNGLYHGTLKPRDTMVVDATELSKHMDKKYDAVIGFMLGAIYEFNKEIWRNIFHESLKLLKDGGFILLTVNQNDEMDFLAESFKAMGVEGEVIDNQDEKSIYDCWVFFARPGTGKI
ncbi:class I SAM-dependent methyltransferase [Methanocella sp. CWC-04]|uniref:Class I SAM-dependent methyltransferase n=1 Tax=Methanooceanicella nereidis TaxID=2052831 RepID=A0AAP2W493_9EURY|nr:class I SAM-dependent methyltransferase [Methanocella sp. CWC-04]MCD1293985.1 class I SAM-dependent methyltransferase [Methanocella sp. CWC-04]